ncbi:transglutaminase family protein [Comamonadaceae bacterium G21597-S1]|nr:transglutaminase family protein [Comamonadaceae bacterium G21597-S1]
MQLSITHTTRYDYAPPVDVAQHIACLRPRTTVVQQLLSHQLSVSPTPSQCRESVDAFGNQRSFLSLQIPHDRLEVTATSVVQTRSLDMSAVALPWEQAAEHFRYRADAVYDADVEFRFPSQHVPRHAEFAAYAQPSFTPDADLHAATLDLMQRIHQEFRYDSQSTEVHTPALEALRQRHGVCQDFAHIMIACLRSLGLSARYVSGYLLTQPPPGQPRLVGADASHAWISLLLPTQDGATRWCDFDPTNDRWGWGAPGDDYVVLALGRDFADVSPIRGVIHGGASHELTVAVTVAPLDAEADTGHTLFDASPAAAPVAPSQTQSQSQSQSKASP